MSQERQEWSELSAQIELLLTEKLENFRTYFPFSCPKDDLKITMKLFTLVSYKHVLQLQYGKLVVAAVL